VRRSTRVEVPVGRALWLVRNAGGLQGGVEAPGVEGVVGVVRGRHGLLGLKRRPLAQNARAGCTEGHLPSLHHAKPRVETRVMGRVLGAGVVGARVPTAVSTAGALVAAAVVAVV
jgi:hypothetical protein